MKPLILKLTNFYRKNETLRLSLSRHKTFNSKVILDPYKSPSDFTKKQFMDAYHG